MKKSKHKSKTDFLLKLEKFFVEQLWQLLIVVAFVFACAWMFSKYDEAVMFCISHIVIRQNFEKQYHCKTTGLCLITTLTIAFFGIASIMPIAVSLLSTIPICWFISWIGYIAQDRLDLILEHKRLKTELEKETKFNTDNCTESELIERCKELKFSEDKIHLAIAFFIDKTKQSEIADKLCIEEKSVQTSKRRLKQKLNN
jgi:hypothetical protein